MARRWFLSATLTAMALAAVPSTPTVGADPYFSPDTNNDNSCDVALTPPQPALIPGGGNGVIATIAPKACHGRLSVDDVSVCVSKAGGPSLCNAAYLYTSVEVTLPTAPTGTFTSTGRLCGMTFEPIQHVCFTSGPITTTL